MKTRFQRPAQFALTVLAVAAVLGLSACGNKDDKKAATQVAARVGSEEVSVHQINQVLRQANTAGATPEAVKNMSREVLEKLIDQQLAVDQATEAKLQRSPEVMAQLESARREILSRAYMQKIAGGLPKATPEEAKKYYAEHPALFSERRVYNLVELVVPKNPATTAAGAANLLRELTAAGKTVDEAAAALKAKDIAFGGGRNTRPAEQIPLDMLSQLHQLKDGQSLVFETPQATSMIRLVASQQAPVAEKDALPRIEQFLNNQRASEAVAANLKQLRANTKITYMGEFSAPGAAVAAAEKNVPNTPSAPASNAQAAIEKGVAGLK